MPSQAGASAAAAVVSQRHRCGLAERHGRRRHRQIRHQSRRDTFSVFEDGIKQQLTFFNRSNLPIALSVLLDTSASMEDKLQTAQDAAIGFVKKLRPQDFGQIIDFDSRVSIAQPFTSSVPDLELAIRKTTPGAPRRCTTRFTSR